MIVCLKKKILRTDGQSVRETETDMSQALFQLLEASNDGDLFLEKEERRNPESQPSENSAGQAIATATADGLYLNIESTDGADSQRKNEPNKIKSFRPKTPFSTEYNAKFLYAANKQFNIPPTPTNSNQPPKIKFQFSAHPNNNIRNAVPTILHPGPVTRPPTPTVPAPTAPNPVVDADDDSESDNDTSYSIVHNSAYPIPCVHASSYSKLHKPNKFISNPYRQTMLSLLHRVRTEPTDNLSPTTPAAASDRLQVYACYQHHWSPKFNVPVLTIVACCNTNIATPQLTRTIPNKFEVSFMCTTDKDQGIVRFKLPIFTTIAVAMEPVIITLGPHHPLPDSLTSYFIRLGETGTILTWIKIWQLSPSGCYSLHNQGIHQPHRPYYEAEIHFLGLTGKRKMPYALNQHCHKTTIIQLLDAKDLGNCGYKKFVRSSKPILPKTGTIVSGMIARALPRTLPHPIWYYYDHKTVIRPQHDLDYKYSAFDPQFYPPAYNHDNYLEFPEPEIFSPGEVPFVFPMILPFTTFNDMINEALRRNPNGDPISTLMTFFNFKREDVPRNTSMTFNSFLAKKESRTGNYNGLCTHDSFFDGHNTGERYLIPKTWYLMNHHPFIREEDMVPIKFKRT